MRAVAAILSTLLAGETLRAQQAQGAPAQGAPAHDAPACPAGPLALVLPGGGVRGMAHVGVIQVLDSLGIVPDLVVGTSMGAIVGALYASGYDGREIERLTRRWDLGASVGRYAPRAPRALGPQPPLLLWEEGESGALDLETAAAQESRVNALLAAMLLRGNLIAAGDFDRLPIPFRAVATDLRTGGRVALGGGDLAEAVRASFAIPLVFDPVVLDGRTLVDGGIAENVPVRLARDLGATRVLLSGLSLTEVQGVPRTPEMAQRMVDLLFDQRYPALGEGDVGVLSRVDSAANLDFRDSTVRAMIARGRAAAIERLTTLPPASLACLTSGHRRAVVVPPLARPLLSAGVPQGPSAREARHFVEKTLGARAGGTLPFDTLQARLARLGAVEAIRGAWLHPVRAAGDTVTLAPVVRLAPRRAVGAGLAYDNDVGGRAWAGVVDRRLLGRPLEGAIRGTAGQWEQEAALELRKGVEDVRDARSPWVLLGWTRADVRLFDARGVELPRSAIPRVQDRRALAGVDLLRWARAEVQVAALVRDWKPDRGDVALPAPDVTQRATTGGVALRVRAGDGESGARGVVRVEGEWTPRYARGVVEAHRAAGGLWQAAGTVRVGLVGRDAPLTTWLPLGGSDGFAGLRIGERLGRAEAFASMDASRAVLGPVRLQLTLMGGQVTTDVARPLDGAWLAGARVGLGAETPIGPMRVQYGVNGDRRTQWYLRAGRWF